MNMLPGATRVDVRDYGLGATHFVRNLLLGPSSFQSEDVSGLRLRNRRPGVPSAPYWLGKAESVGVHVVLASAYVLEVNSPVVGLDSVPVVDVEPFRPCAEKGRSNQDVNTDRLLAPIVKSEPNLEIAATQGGPEQYARVADCNATPTYSSSRERLDPSKVRHNVTSLTPLDNSPTFTRHIERHCFSQGETPSLSRSVQTTVPASGVLSLAPWYGASAWSHWRRWRELSRAMCPKARVMLRAVSPTVMGLLAPTYSAGAREPRRSRAKRISVLPPSLRMRATKAVAIVRLFASTHLALAACYVSHAEPPIRLRAPGRSRAARGISRSLHRLRRTFLSERRPA